MYCTVGPWLHQRKRPAEERRTKIFQMYREIVQLSGGSSCFCRTKPDNDGDNDEDDDDMMMMIMMMMMMIVYTTTYFLLRLKLVSFWWA